MSQNTLVGWWIRAIAWRAGPCGVWYERYYPCYHVGCDLWARPFSCDPVNLCVFHCQRSLEMMHMQTGFRTSFCSATSGNDVCRSIHAIWMTPNSPTVTRRGTLLCVLILAMHRPCWLVDKRRSTPAGHASCIRDCESCSTAAQG